MASLLDHDFGSESEDDNFNPAPAEESDNDAADGSDAEVSIKRSVNERRRSSVGSNTPPESSKKKSNGRERAGHGSNGAGVNGDEEDDEEANGSVHDDDDDEEDEEDDDDEEAVTGRPRKRLRRDPRNQYLDVEAEVDEDEDEDNDEDEEGQGDPFIADIHPDDVDELPAGAEKDDRRHRELDRQRDQVLQMDAEKQAEILKEKYGRSTRPGASTAIITPRRYLLPSVSDPSIWAVKCKPGKEKELIFAITKRREERAHTRAPIPIICAFERAAMPGYVYIEAPKQADVFAALDGVSNIYPRTKILLVPIKERPDLLRVIKNKELHPGEYVRIKRGLYAGDLAAIEDTEVNGNEVSLRLVPRLSYGLEEDNKAPMVTGTINAADRKRKAGPNKLATRPPQRLFSEVEAKKKHAKHLSHNTSTSEKKQWTYYGKIYVNGFLLDDYKIQNVQTENVNPKLEEVTMFTQGGADGTENLDLAALAASLKNTTSNESYLPGDVVEVYDGEQQGVYGKAVAVTGDIVTLSVIEGDLRGQKIEVPVKALRKRFKEGDHVKVIGGSRYRDEVGMVVRIKNDNITILSDLSMQEITVFSKDLREASDSGGAGVLSQYEIHDLVQLDPATVACVTKVDRESLRVLDQNGSVRAVMPSQISNKLERRRHAVATDRDGSEIRIDDTVREVGGEGKQGVIIHIYRSYIFIYNREQAENSGTSVLRATNVKTVAAKGGRVAQASSGPDLTKMNPALQRNGMNGTNGANGMPPPKSFGRDRALGQTVTIRKGAYKGLLGIVKDTTDTEARVELHTKSKTVTVPKEVLSFKDPITGQSMDYSRFSGFRGRGGGRAGFAGAGSSSRIPDGGRTPMGVAQGGRTPAWEMAAGGRTPAHGTSSARTPAWQQSGMSGGRTPAYGGGGGGGATVNPYADGSRTAYGGLGGRTPAWDPSSRTSYGGATNDPFSSSRTPAYEPSARTPAYASSSSYNNDQYSSFHQPSSTTASNDPRNARAAYDAPTPAAAPTPSASGLTANGNAYGASTPAAAAATPYGGDVETPYSGQPETPGWGAGEDGPRYDEGTPSP